MHWRIWLPGGLFGLFGLFSFSSAGSGCTSRDLQPLSPCVVNGFVESVRGNQINEIDLLFVVDNSNSMEEEQISLSEQIPRLVEILLSGDQDEDGIQDFPPISSLHVGVISTDMGIGTVNEDVCNEVDVLSGNPLIGDDGYLNNRGSEELKTPCPATYPSRFLAYEQGMSQPIGEFANDVRCIADLGTDGCGFEQQLEATLKSLTPNDSALQFNQNGSGQNTAGNGGGGVNSGFLRPNSLLAVIVVTDEDDCSASDLELFQEFSPTYTSDRNIRCTVYEAQALRTVNRYVNGFLALRNDPELLVFATISGVDAAVLAETVGEENPGTYIQQLEALLETENMTPVINESATGLVPSCTIVSSEGVDRGEAFPPRRLVDLAIKLELAGSNGVVQSICTDDFSPAIDTIIDRIGNVLGSVCLPRALPRSIDGLVNCNVVETLPLDGEVTSCDAIPGRTLNRVDATTGAEICQVNQIPIDEANPEASLVGQEGWYYDNFSPSLVDECSENEQQRVRYIVGQEPRSGVQISLECLLSTTSSGNDVSSAVQLGTPCQPGTGGTSFCSFDVVEQAETGMICDDLSATCQFPCDADADCPGSLVCDRERSDGNGTPHPICQNPTCPLD